MENDALNWLKICEMCLDMEEKLDRIEILIKELKDKQRTN